MIDLLTVEKAFIESHIKEGGTVVDFTMGNGHDTLWLSNKVGANGKVYAFDVQQAALDSSEKLVEDLVYEIDNSLVAAVIVRHKNARFGGVYVGKDRVALFHIRKNFGAGASEAVNRLLDIANHKS